MESRCGFIPGLYPPLVAEKTLLLMHLFVSLKRQEAVISFIRTFPEVTEVWVNRYWRNVILFSLLQLRTRARFSPLLPIKPRTGGKSGLETSSEIWTKVTMDGWNGPCVTACKYRQVRRTK